MEENRYTKYLELFLPAAVVLDADDTVLHFFGNYADYLSLSGGKAHAEFLQHAAQGFVPGGGHGAEPLPRGA